MNPDPRPNPLPEIVQVPLKPGDRKILARLLGSRRWSAIDRDLAEMFLGKVLYAAGETEPLKRLCA